jgi:hypothetical protein
MLKIFFLTIIVLLISTSAFGISADPIDVAVGARPLGMGKAFVGMLSDGSSLFINPSGLSGVQNLSAVSMSGRLLQEVDYVALGLVNPFTFGTLGLGYIGSGVNGIMITRKVGGTIEAYDSTDYSNNVLVASYAAPLSLFGFLPKYDFINKISVGTNLKYYMQGFSSLPGGNGTGTGFDIDLGVGYKPNSIFSLGATLQNALPASLGGKFTWQKNNVEEGIPAVLKIGGAINVLDESVWIALDSDIYVKEDKPAVWHAGFEWWLLRGLALRLGLDQQSSPVQVDNNLTAGIGVKYSGFTFDYAYHQYGEISENSTHYFSLGYSGIEKVKPVEEIIPPELKPITELKLRTFKDVPAGYWAKEPIEYLATAGVISGYPDDTFKPDNKLSRAELCTLLIKAKGISVEAVAEAVFPDLPAAHWAAPYIKASVDLGLVSGYPDGTFLPNKSLTRAEAVKILAVFDGLEKTKAAESAFPDVLITHWAAQYIQAAELAGILDYLKDRDFEANQGLTRAEAAEMISKTSFGRAKIRGLIK